VFVYPADWAKSAAKLKIVAAEKPVSKSPRRIRFALRPVVGVMTARRVSFVTTWPGGGSVSMTVCFSRRRRRIFAREIAVFRRMQLRSARVCFVWGKFKPRVEAIALETIIARRAKAAIFSKGLERMVQPLWSTSALSLVSLGGVQVVMDQAPFAWVTKNASAGPVSRMSVGPFAATVVIALVGRSAPFSPLFWMWKPLGSRLYVCPHKEGRSRGKLKRGPPADNRPIVEALAVSYLRERIRAFALIAAAVIPSVQEHRFV